ncbi:diaminopimelate epimerase [Desulfurivibrio alkaliphilus]|uniref:Diaminopimelate epimerase n=1 Tax=Desulfurivibrio alkaliphilus (strain DSM 19089 / UNIQEM U267 / AHT2) TaxID=589865 RepID=D6Z6B6_DESAT|nr:diaminopimelate epimerase [Desulfurivibrio alkaliphilus]ADH86881.1 diaminopimelate epimerase [Desulfurivibrio alkaliphilus AHT 2]
MQFPISFTKMSGAGNDFILMDHRRPLFADTAAAQKFARAVCRRKFSVGADGLILIEESKEADFRWQFFNADGSVAEMCGNGARCAARFAYERKIAPARMHFATLAGIIEAEITGTNVGLTMTPPENLQLDLRLDDPAGGEQTVHLVNTGVPHAVLLVDDIDVVPVKEWGRHFRFHPRFAPAGANVNFVGRETATSDLLRVRTYERGVEDETLACGTGAVAAALVASCLDLTAAPTRVITSGRDELVIHYHRQGRDFTGVKLEGPADFIYEGQLHQEALRRG